MSKAAVDDFDMFLIDLPDHIISVVSPSFWQSPMSLLQRYHNVKYSCTKNVPITPFAHCNLTIPALQIHWKSMFRSNIRPCCFSQSQFSSRLPDTSLTNRRLAAELDQKLRESSQTIVWFQPPRKPSRLFLHQSCPWFECQTMPDCTLRKQQPAHWKLLWSISGEAAHCAKPFFS